MAPTDRQPGFAGPRRLSRDEFTQLAQTIAVRIARFLEREGLLERDAENSYLASEAVDDGPMDQLLGHSITCRIPVGPQQGPKVFTLQMLPVCDPYDSIMDTAGKVAGFSLHVGVAAKANERAKRKRLCRYVSRPAVFRKALLTDRSRQHPLSTEDTLPGWDDTCDVTPGLLPCGPAFGCSKSLPAILSNRRTLAPG